MATKKTQPATPAGKEVGDELQDDNNPLAKVENGLEKFHRPSHDLIYETIMRSGGEPFGNPYGIGISTLTNKVVKFFKQRSFFGFETFEPSRPKRRRNRFTRHGASRYFGDYNLAGARRAAEEVEKRRGKQKKKK